MPESPGVVRPGDADLGANKTNMVTSNGGEAGGNTTTTSATILGGLNVPHRCISQNRAKELVSTATNLLAGGRGILAVDEPPFRMEQRLGAVGVTNTPENRLAWRETMFKTPELGQYISGVILHEETLYQEIDGLPIPNFLREKAQIIPGIKVDGGVLENAGPDGEKSTAGLDSLQTRCEAFYNAGARFTKWRCVLEIKARTNGDGTSSYEMPSAWSLNNTAWLLARYAAISQAAGLVPIVEPEVIPDGTHGIEICAQATELALAATFAGLAKHGVLLEGCLLKPNMVTPGAAAPGKEGASNSGFKSASASEVAGLTLRTLSRTVPPALAGVVFLSGGQSEEDASKNLSKMNSTKTTRHPWTLTFSYGRAMQATALKKWGESSKPDEAQGILLARAKSHNAAALGRFGDDESKEQSSSESLFVSGYTY
ncbi:unnamed protein product [Amoebophrya sp. A25]|nr:unnamed protein product [Amoebophrya sp. A25]|eukprot:GSA25T00006403001.1